MLVVAENNKAYKVFWEKKMVPYRIMLGRSAEHNAPTYIKTPLQFPAFTCKIVEGTLTPSPHDPDILFFNEAENGLVSTGRAEYKEADRLTHPFSRRKGRDISFGAALKNLKASGAVAPDVLRLFGEEFNNLLSREKNKRD